LNSHKHHENFDVALAQVASTTKSRKNKHFIDAELEQEQEFF